MILNNKFGLFLVLFTLFGISHVQAKVDLDSNKVTTLDINCSLPTTPNIVVGQLELIKALGNVTPVTHIATAAFKVNGQDRFLAGFGVKASGYNGGRGLEIYLQNVKKYLANDEKLVSVNLSYIPNASKFAGTAIHVESRPVVKVDFECSVAESLQK